MWDRYDSFGWWFFVFMPVVMFAICGLVAWVIVTRARATRPDRATPAPPSGAETVLAERFARGEIDAEELHRRLQDLQAAGLTGAGR